MTHQNIILEHVEPGIHMLTVKRPKAFNALNAAMLGEPGNAITHVVEDAAARVPPKPGGMPRSQGKIKAVTTCR